ncbi:MAG: D-alanine--D-alanine ligase [Candidatus Saccharibacteria bacterium]|nr:D-alanine--D-alanine ligase [Candidatus Saccharibacteria bacterium]
MNKPTVAVIFGSRSAEHDVSIVTALASVIKPLELSKQYNVVPVYIAKDGRWFSDPKLKDIQLFSSGAIDEFMRKSKPVALEFGKGLKLIQSGGMRNRSTTIDIVFPATHGTYGEDGTLMGVLEMANVPFVGCDVAASAIAMDKVLSKQQAIANNILTPKFVYFTRHDFARQNGSLLNKIEKDLQYPLFVKPAHLGSSIGITRVMNRNELENAIEVALHYDSKALVEEGVSNLIEVTQPIIGNDNPQLAHLEQPLTQAEDFFDFDTKYMKGGKKGKGGAKTDSRGAQGYSKIPADLPTDLYEKAQSIAVEVYRAVGCSGIARIDMLIDSKSGQVYFNEINPMPGSLYSHNWNKAGVSNINLVTRLVELAIEKHAEKQKIATTFSTNYLKQF